MKEFLANFLCSLKIDNLFQNLKFFGNRFGWWPHGPSLNTLGTMGSTSGPHYILTKKFIEKRFLFRFSQAVSYTLCLFCFVLAIFLNHLLHSEMFLGKTVQTKKNFSQSEQKVFIFFCCCQAHFSWFLLPDFLVAASTASSDIAQE